MNFRSGWTLLRPEFDREQINPLHAGPNLHEKLKEESDNQSAIFRQRMFRMIGDNRSTSD